MYKRILRKRILKGVVIALALFAVIPVTNAAAKPVSVGQPDPWLQSLLLNRHAIQVGPTAAELKADTARGQGMNQKYRLGQYAIGPTLAERNADIARGQGMNQKYDLGRYAVSSEISTGLPDSSQPQTVVASTGSDFEWSNAWIGAGILAALLFGAAATLAVRSRHHGGLAH